MLDEQDSDTRLAVGLALAVALLITAFSIGTALVVSGAFAENPAAAAVAPAAGAAPAPAAAQANDAPASGLEAAMASTSLHFDVGHAELPAGAAEQLRPLVEAANLGQRIVISGFHDASGDPERNAELAKQRAFAVRDALRAAGVAEDRIELRKPQQTLGSGDPAAARRVEVRAAPAH